MPHQCTSPRSPKVYGATMGGGWVWCVDLSSLGGTPSPRVQDLEGKAPQESLMGLEPKHGVFP